MKLVAIYARVSTLDQHPENQIISLKEYVDNRKDWELFKLYQDKVSGAKQSRPQLDQLMKDARQRKFDHVVFWKVDRLGRNAIHVQTIANEWKKLGIDFTITTLGIDTSTTSGRFIFGIMAQFAQMEREMTSERTKLAYQKAKKQGKHWGRPKGSKDKKPRKKSGYYIRWIK